MIALLARARFAAAMLVLGGFILLNPMAHATPAPGVLDPEAHVANEQTLLQQGARIEGDILIPDTRARVLIQPAGREWRYFHEIILRWIGGLAIVGTVGALTAAYFFLGRIRISSGRSGRRVKRFTAFERFAHWLTATSFIVLGLTGINVTFGKLLLRPVIGPDAFSAWSEAAKYAHNFTSVPFVIGLVTIATLFLKDNIPDKVDVEWLRQGGGLIGSRHPPARRFNAGEKAVYWIALAAGALAILSGVLLIFPFYVTNIFGMQIAQAVHGVVALLFVAVILSHIYIGTLGMEGAFEAMATGTVDYNWAKEHHNLWLEEELAKQQRGALTTRAAATPAE